MRCACLTVQLHVQDDSCSSQASSRRHSCRRTRPPQAARHAHKLATCNLAVNECALRYRLPCLLLFTQVVPSLKAAEVLDHWVSPFAIDYSVW